VIPGNRSVTIAARTASREKRRWGARGLRAWRPRLVVGLCRAGTRLQHAERADASPALDDAGSENEIRPGCPQSAWVQRRSFRADSNVLCTAWSSTRGSRNRDRPRKPWVLQTGAGL